MAENVNGVAEDQEPLKLSQDDETSAQNSTQTKGRRRGHLRRRPKSDAPAEATCPLTRHEIQMRRLKLKPAKYRDIRPKLI